MAALLGSLNHIARKTSGHLDKANKKNKRRKQQKATKCAFIAPVILNSEIITASPTRRVSIIRKYAWHQHLFL